MTTSDAINRENRKCSRIRPFLYVAGVAGLSPGVLGRFGTVINLIPGFRLRAPARLNVYHIAIDDDEGVDLTPYWTTVFKAIDEERKKRRKVLLLCGMGISRSAAFAVGYLMCIEKLTLHDSYKHVQHCRPVVCPNVGFFRQLIELEEKMFNRRTVSLIEPMKGVIVADVVWNELYEEMMESMTEEERGLMRNCQKSTAKPCSSPSSSVSTIGSSSSNSDVHLELDRLSLRST
ncbi:hypothetical protein PFISCL1PPCAC_10674 [Pristionchus fissidentatus]|uniref:Uncharacterized protein n=1 Tax=Pristionchus fissidentatus TaxID=1538716 RepID=A0AAV5VMV8_9BILA|nr:hypothetical protein PFISCL1PPCAC_10674 [Pristionchus fissidentatus]